MLPAPCVMRCPGRVMHCARCRETVRSSNAAVVLQTLVPQAREIFRLLAQAQLAPVADEEGSEGASPCSARSVYAIWGHMPSQH